ELDLVRGAEALRHPLHDLLWRAGAGDAGGGEAGPEDREADACVAPEQLLERDRKGEARLVTAGRLGEEVEGVEADLRGLLDDRPRELLLLVPYVRRGAHVGLGDVADPLLDLLLILAQLQGELAHRDTSRRSVGCGRPASAVSPKIPLSNQNRTPELRAVRAHLPSAVRRYAAAGGGAGETRRGRSCGVRPELHRSEEHTSELQS